MKLSNIISDLEIVQRYGEGDPEIRSLVFDSRQVGPGDLFVAIRGGQADGHLFIPQALEKEAAVIVSEEAPSGASGVIRLRNR